jgi:branched-chain amino acid transport system permease protein
VFLATALQQLINGLDLGSIYALIALGYTMVYGIVKLINFAHGEVMMVGAYIGFFVMTGLDADPDVSGVQLTF